MIKLSQHMRCVFLLHIYCKGSTTRLHTTNLEHSETPHEFVVGKVVLYPVISAVSAT